MGWHCASLAGHRSAAPESLTLDFACGHSAPSLGCSRDCEPQLILCKGRELCLHPKEPAFRPLHTREDRKKRVYAASSVFVAPFLSCQRSFPSRLPGALLAGCETGRHKQGQMPRVRE